MAKTEANSITPNKRRVWGRRMGRPLKKDRLDALEKTLPRLSVSKDILTEDRTLDPNSLFPSSSECWLEIGFGNGEHVLGLMERYPNVNFLAAEPFINGMSAFLTQLIRHPDRSLAKQGVAEGSSQTGQYEDPSTSPGLNPGSARNDNLENVRVLMDDAMMLVRSLTNESLERIYILNPDPWPKARHHKRRIVSQANLDEFARVLKPGGQLILTTDVADLADWMVTHTFNHPAFEWQAKRADDWRIAPADWIPTRYEVKQANHSSKKMAYMFFRKKLAKPIK